MNRGILIAVEGIDGAGKTTQVNLLASFLAEFGQPIVQSKEPTNGPWGQRIRKSAANGRMGLEEELRAFIEDRKEHISNLIGPALNEGKTVILDRYLYSTIAYQGVRMGNIEAVARAAFESAILPDAVVILDVPAETGVDRIRKRDGKENQFEDVDNLRAVRSAFLHVAKLNSLAVVDGAQPVAAVRKAILKAIIDNTLRRHYCAKSWDCDAFYCIYRITNSCQWVRMKKRAANLD